VLSLSLSLTHFLFLVKCIVGSGTPCSDRLSTFSHTIHELRPKPKTGWSSPRCARCQAEPVASLTRSSAARCFKNTRASPAPRSSCVTHFVSKGQSDALAFCAFKPRPSGRQRIARPSMATPQQHDGHATCQLHRSIPLTAATAATATAPTVLQALLQRLSDSAPFARTRIPAFSSLRTAVTS